MSSRYPRYLQEMMPESTIYNGGVSGEFSGSVAVRQGGVVAAFRVESGALPTSGEAGLAFTNEDRGWASEYPGIRLGWQPNEASPMPGTLAGVHGTLTAYAEGTEESIRFGFTPDKPGEAAPVGEDVTFVPDSAEAQAEAVHIIMVGRNNPQNVGDVLEDIASMVAATSDDRYLILSTINATDEGEGSGATYSRIVEGINQGLAETYGEQYLDVRRLLIQEGLDRAGISPTPADRADIAADTVPTSLRVPNDVVHLSFADPPQIGQKSGDEVLAELVHEKLIDLGWAEPA
jgi:hypothetical protein